MAIIPPVGGGGGGSGGGMRVGVFPSRAHRWGGAAWRNVWYGRLVRDTGPRPLSPVLLQGMRTINRPVGRYSGRIIQGSTGHGPGFGIGAFSIPPPDKWRIPSRIQPVIGRGRDRAVRYYAGWYYHTWIPYTSGAPAVTATGAVLNGVVAPDRYRAITSSGGISAVVLEDW